MVLYTDLKKGLRLIAKDKYRLSNIVDSDSLITIVRVSDDEQGVNTEVFYKTHHGKEGMCKLGWLKEYWEKLPTNE